MTKHIHKQLKKQAKQVHLTAGEKQRYKSAFQEYMQQHPAPEHAASPRWTIFHIFGSPMPYIAGFLVMILAGSGVSYAAEGALPGDTLYSVKVSINEEVRGLFYTSNESRAVYEAQRVSERLAEVEKLTNRNQITEANLSQVSANIESHLESIEQYTGTSSIASSSTSAPKPKIATETSATSSTSTPTHAAEEKPDDTAATSTHSDSASDQEPTQQPNSSGAGTMGTMSTDNTETDGHPSPQQASQEKNKSSKHLQFIKKHVEKASSTLPQPQSSTLKQKLSEAQSLYKKGVTALKEKNAKDAVNSFEQARSAMNNIESTLRERLDASAMSEIGVFATSTATSTASSAATSTDSHSTSTATSTAAAASESTTSGTSTAETPATTTPRQNTATSTNQ